MVFYNHTMIISTVMIFCRFRSSGIHSKGIQLILTLANLWKSLYIAFEWYSFFYSKIFCRLVSAYEDKVLNNNSNDGQLKKFSNNFPAFVDYILKQYKRSSCYHKHNTPCGINVHWRPYNARCLYCDISYDVIGRMETFDEDFKYILARKNLTDLFNRSGTHIHKSQR